MRRLAALLPLLLACDDGDLVDNVPTGDAVVRVVNATQAPLDVLVDGAVAIRGVPVAAVTPLFVASGTRRMALRPAAGGVGAEVSVEVASGGTVTTAAVPVGASLAAAVLTDTNAVVPAGKSRLRVSNLAPSAPGVEIFRTQPDFATPVRIQTPFPYRETSPYLQSDAGTWEVFLAPAGSDGAPKGLTTGPVPIPGGGRRTVILLDSAGVLRFRVLAD